MAITLVTGNIFDSTCECLVNPINSVGVMGAGLAKQFLKKFPRACNFSNTALQIANGKLSPEEVELVRPNYVGLPLFNQQPALIMFPTKTHWKLPSKLEYIERNMPIAVMQLNSFGIKSVAFPLLGCGLGGLDKTDVIPIMTKYLEDYKGLVEVYV